MSPAQSHENGTVTQFSLAGTPPKKALPNAEAARMSKAYRAIDNYVHHRAVQILAKHHKVSSRGIRQFLGEQVFGELGLQRLRSLVVARRSWALA